LLQNREPGRMYSEVSDTPIQGAGSPTHLTNSILLGAGRLVLVLRLVLDDSQIGTQKADKFILTRGVSHEPRASAGDLSFGGRSWDGRRRSLL
jgi:hypothetical protein